MSDQSSRPPTSRDIADWLGSLRRAAAFLTVLPVAPPGFTDRPLSATLPAFPLVGAGIGLICGLVWLLLRGFEVDDLLAAVLAVGVGVLLTRALHEDGLADMADALGPPDADRERRLEILRDSRIGAFGALALIFSIGLRAVALSELSPMAGLAVLVAAHALSRAALGWPWGTLLAARPDGLAAGEGAPDRATLNLTLAIGAGVGALCLLLGAGVMATLLALAVAALATVGISRVAATRFGGYTGDVLGATQQTAEIAVLVVAAAIVG
jgi:adenosylcobinamide-GDP ribazoletransferase